MLIKLEKPVSFYPQLAKLLGGIKEALYYQQISYWSDKGSREDGFIYKTKEEIEEETFLTRDEQDRVRKKLEKNGWMMTKVMLANGHPTLHYKLTDRKEEIPRMEKWKTHDSNSGKPANYITENTTENTTYNTNNINIIREAKPPLNDEEIELAKRKNELITYLEEKSGLKLRGKDKMVARGQITNIWKMKFADKHIRQAIDWWAKDKEDLSWLTWPYIYRNIERWESATTYKK